LIARDESKKYFPKEKTVLIGNPVSEAIINIKQKVEVSHPATIYVTGGSSGAQRINNVINEILYELLKNYKIIHQTGKLDFDKFIKRKEEFPADLKKRYEVYDFIDPVDISTIFEKSDVIVSRAGANTLSEISVTRRPAILIPIPWTSNNEQTKNAKMLVSTGLAIMIEEKDLNGEFLLQKIDFVIGNWKKMTKDSDNSLAELDKNAAKKFVGEIERILK
jgi:UDP-N-acetylglucosamine--N-acetylmuramyl-(pentapeptide) pyrophosphoryl-undecaprenol N-acetylglucosamine transferase